MIADSEESWDIKQEITVNYDVQNTSFSPQSPPKFPEAEVAENINNVFHHAKSSVRESDWKGSCTR